MFKRSQDEKSYIKKNIFTGKRAQRAKNASEGVGSARRQIDRQIIYLLANKLGFSKNHYFQISLGRKKETVYN